MIHADWLVKGEVQKLVLVITGIETHEVLERWAFEVHSENGTGNRYICNIVQLLIRLLLLRLLLTQLYRVIWISSATSSKSKKEIMTEIQAIIRQITASVSFLPLLEEQCAFDLLVYTDKNSEVPALWEESDPRYIKDSAEVRLRSFSTKVRFLP